MSLQMMTRKAAAGRLPARPARIALRVNAVARPSTKSISFASSAALLAALAQAAPARAEAVPATISGDVDTAIDQLVSAIKAASTVIKSGVDVVSAGLETVKEGYTTAEPYLKSTYTTVEPIIQQAVGVTGDALKPVITAATPIIQDSVADAVAASGVKVDDVVVPVTKAAQTAATVATPLLTEAFKFLTTTSPVLLGEYALGAFALYLVAPPVLGLLAFALRGYAGELPATAAVDLLINGNAVLVDLRSQKEKESSGLPDLPNSARNRVAEVEFALTEDRKLRGSLRDPNSIEVQVTALQVSALKSINKGTVLLLLDRYGGNSVAVAKELCAKGFGKAYVIAGGFDGRNGWVQSKLQIKPAAVDLAPAAARSISTRKSLPAPR